MAQLIKKDLNGLKEKLKEIQLDQIFDLTDYFPSYIGLYLEHIQKEREIERYRDFN